jgi:hypothetical protein
MSQIKKYKPNIKRRFRIKHSQMMTMIGWPTPSQQAPMPNPQKILQHEEGLRMEGEARVGAKAGAKVEAKVEAKAEAKLEAKGEAKSGVKLGAKAEVKFEAKVEAKHEEEEEKVLVETGKAEKVVVREEVDMAVEMAMD